jgi:hypothetical protein
MVLMMNIESPIPLLGGDEERRDEKAYISTATV